MDQSTLNRRDRTVVALSLVLWVYLRDPDNPRETKRRVMAWLDSYNQQLDAVPRDLIETIDGANRVLEYLMRMT